MQTNIEDRVITLISEVSRIPKEKISPEIQLVDLNIDSLVIVELSFKLRKEFDIPKEIDEALDRAETVDEIVDLVKRSEARKVS